MDYSIFIWEIIIYVIISIISSIIYMYCDYQDSNKFYKLFIPKNDSIWERIKVLIGPALVITILQLLLFKVSSNMVFAKLLSLIAMTLINPILFIIYFKFSSWDMMIINVLTTVTSASVGLLVSILILAMPIFPNVIIYISIFGIALAIAFYLIATYHQTEDMIFLDPITKKMTLKKDI